MRVTNNEPQPFEVKADPDHLAWIWQRVAEYDLSSLPVVPGWELGTSAKHVERLRTYWLESYDWEESRTELNRLPQFQCVIDGIPLHFVHVEVDRAAPTLLLAHGWPGSVYEFYDAIDLFCDPRAPVRFNIVAPSLPGFGFSNPLPAPVGCRRIAEVFDALMGDVLGYQSYIAQGGDWGSFIASWIGFDHSDRCRAIHLSADGLRPVGAGSHDNHFPAEIWSKEEREFFAHERGVWTRDTAYMHLQGTRPQALAYAMHDSPLGVGAWINEKFHEWSNLPADKDPGDHFGWDRLMTNLMLYVVPQSFATASWIYAGFERDDPKTLPAGERITVPAGFAAFADPVVPVPPRSLFERVYDVIQWNDMPTGGHFGAFEVPELYVGDVREFVGKLSL